MAFKFVTFFGLICLSSAVVLQNQEYPAPSPAHIDGLSYGYENQKGHIAAVAAPAPVYKEYAYSNQIAPAAYDFNYEVHDEHTGDIKSQKEIRNGDSVQGRYELIDSDGYKRVVEYTADEHNGFNAIVHREPVDFTIPQPIPQEPKFNYAAPTNQHIPVQAAQPVNKAVVFSAPKYAVQSKPVQYYVNPTYTKTAYASAPTASLQQQHASHPVYSVPVQSHAFENAEQIYNAYRFPSVQPNTAYTSQGYSAPVYSSPAYVAPAQIYSVPQQKVVSVPVQTYNAHSNAAVGYNTHAVAAPAHDVHYYPNVQIPQGYYSAPAVQKFYTAPVATKLAYSTPVSVGSYAKQLSDSAKYYVAGRAVNNVHLQSGFSPIPTVATKVSVYSTPAPVLSSVAPKTEISSNGHSSQSASEQLKSESGYSAGVTSSYGAYTVSSTPSYKH